MEMKLLTFNRAIKLASWTFLFWIGTQVIVAQSSFSHCKAKVKWVSGKPFIKHIKIYTQGDQSEIFIKNLRKKNELESKWEIYSDPGGTLTLIKDSLFRIQEGKADWGQEIAMIRPVNKAHFNSPHLEMSTLIDTVLIKVQEPSDSQADSMTWTLYKPFSIGQDQAIPVKIDTDLLTLTPYSRKLGWMNCEETSTLKDYPFILKIVGSIIAVESWVNQWDSKP